MKLSPAGRFVWTATSNTPALSEFFSALELDSVGNVIILGSQYAGLNVTPNSVMTQKWSSDGHLMWIRHYGSETSKPTFNRPADLIIDGKDNVFVHGYCRNVPTTLKYSAAGDPVWTRKLVTPEGESFGAALALSPKGDFVYLTGTLRTGTAPEDWHSHFQTTRYRN